MASTVNFAPLECDQERESNKIENNDKGKMISLHTIKIELGIKIFINNVY